MYRNRGFWIDDFRHCIRNFSYPDKLTRLKLSVPFNWAELIWLDKLNETVVSWIADSQRWIHDFRVVWKRRAEHWKQNSKPLRTSKTYEQISMNYRYFVTVTKLLRRTNVYHFWFLKSKGVGVGPLSTEAIAHLIWGGGGGGGKKILYLNDFFQELRFLGEKTIYSSWNMLKISFVTKYLGASSLNFWWENPPPPNCYHCSLADPPPHLLFQLVLMPPIRPSNQQFSNGRN